MPAEWFEQQVAELMQRIKDTPASRGSRPLAFVRARFSETGPTAGRLVLERKGRVSGALGWCLAPFSIAPRLESSAPVQLE